VSSVSPVDVEPVVSSVSATLTSEVVIRSTEILARQNAEHFRQEAARVQHIQAVQRQQRLPGVAPARGTAAGSRFCCTPAYRLLWIFAGADKTGISLRTAGSRGCRVQNFRAEGRHFRRLFKGNFINTFAAEPRGSVV
jgi:hypothetical protein